MITKPKQAQLEAIANEIERCKICKIGKSGKAVPGEGNPDAQVMFVGEAPGRQEAQTGRPFIGRSGQLLRSLIRGAGLKEKDVYITSPVKYLPDRGTPLPSDIVHGKTHFDKQLAIIKPKIVVLLGRVAGEAVLERKIAVVKERGTVIKKDGQRFFVTLHPAAALRFVKFKKLLVEDFEKLANIVK